MQVDDPWLAGGQPAPLHSPPAGSQQPKPPKAPPPQHLLEAAARSHAAWVAKMRHGKGKAKPESWPTTPRTLAKGGGVQPPLPPGPPPRPRVCSWTARPHQPPKQPPTPLPAPYPRWPMPTRLSHQATVEPQAARQEAQVAEKAAPTPRAAILVAAAKVQPQRPKAAKPAVLVSAAAVAAAPPGAASAAAAAGMVLTQQRHLKARLVARRVNAILRHGGSGRGGAGPGRAEDPLVELDASGAAKLDDLAANLRIDKERCRYCLVSSQTRGGKPRFLLQQLGDGKTYVWKVDPDEPQRADAGVAATGAGGAAAAPSAGAVEATPPAGGEAEQSPDTKSEPASPEGADCDDDLPDFSDDVAPMQEVDAEPATVCADQASAAPAPVQGKAPTQIVG